MGLSMSVYFSRISLLQYPLLNGSIISMNIHQYSYTFSCSPIVNCDLWWRSQVTRKGWIMPKNSITNRGWAFVRCQWCVPNGILLCSRKTMWLWLFQSEWLLVTITIIAFNRIIVLAQGCWWRRIEEWRMGKVMCYGTHTRSDWRNFGWWIFILKDL